MYTYVTYMYIRKMYAHYIILIMHVLCNYTLAVDQVTGVTLTCQPVRLANQCTVMWNVNLYMCTV